MHHVLLCMQPQLLRDAMRQRVANHSGLRVIGEVQQEIDLLIAIRATNATLIVHTWPGDEPPAIYTHLFAEFPGLVILGLTPSGKHSWLCQQRVVQTPVTTRDFDALLSTLSVPSPVRVSA
jgi:hypothetical protein